MRRGGPAGPARSGAVTKRLARELRPGEVAVIAHRDLDGATAADLVAARPAAVVNGLCSVTGRLPARGARKLLEAGIPLLDEAGPQLLRRVRTGQYVRLVGDRLLDAGGRTLAKGTRLDLPLVERRLGRAGRRLPTLAERFLTNTLGYLARERALLLGQVPVPPLATRMAGRPALVVVRSESSRLDLAALRSLMHRRPALIGVDGGADLLLEAGLRPDLVVGDMDSVSDRALAAARELVVHAYPTGGAPGLSRVRSLGRFAHVMASPGTSEDVALLLAHGAGARPIVAVGARRDLQAFLERGRPGMASTLLVGMRLGHELVDVRGLGAIVAPGEPWLSHATVVAAAACCLTTIALASQALRLMVRLWWARLLAGLLLGGVG